MDQETKDVILEALAMKTASIKRARTGANPRFAQIYEAEQAIVDKGRQYIMAIKVT